MVAQTIEEEVIYCDTPPSSKAPPPPPSSEKAPFPQDFEVINDEEDDFAFQALLNMRLD